MDFSLNILLNLTVISHLPLSSIPVVTAREEAPVPTPNVRSRTPSLTEQAPLPHFITQFKGMKWFDKLFPNANPSVSVTLQCPVELQCNLIL